MLYRLARHKEARAVYEACAAAPKVTESDFTWALLQAGNCCRRLGDFDEAIKHFQTLIAAYPDSPWSKGHVAWALQTAQWEKRCQRLEPSTGE